MIAVAPTMQSIGPSEWLPPEMERHAGILEAHHAYRVLRSLPPLDLLSLPEPHGAVRTAVVLDTETTGLNSTTGKIIELALCAIQFDNRGRVVGIGPVCDWLEDPGEPLTPEISRLTGLTDSDLAGKQIDDDAARAMLSGAHLLVAHNASFDAAWIEQRYPDLAGRAWCCSLRDVDWKRMGYESRQLGALLGEVAGLFNTRHRADADVAALVTLLTAPLSSGRTACAEMMMSARHPTIRIGADRAPFEMKNLLKARGYRWDARRRHWWTEVRQDAVDAECAWLAETVRCPNPSLTEITWFQRHRG